MKKLVLFALGLFLLGTAVATAQENAAILRFRTMIGNSGPFIGNQTPIRGIPAGGAAWVVRDGAQGVLRQNGKLEIEVRGLVLVDTQMNPVANFRGLVSCLSINEDGDAFDANVSTGDFPADSDGNSTIEATVDLPDPCFAPIIFVTSPGGNWFATTGS